MLPSGTWRCRIFATSSSSYISTIAVSHNDRDIEFILFKRELEALYSHNVLQLDYKSCEMMAEELIGYISQNYPNRNITVEIGEDGENGATLVYECHWRK